MRVLYETKKFYYGFLVYILAYSDEVVGVGVTTGLSSYSLGQMVMIGCGSTTHAARVIKYSDICSFNLFGAETTGLFKHAGTVSDGHKLRGVYVPLSDHDGIPVLGGPQMSLLCRVLEAMDDGIYIHFRCTTIQRLVDSALIGVRGRFRYEDLCTVEYVGNPHRHIYRYSSGRVERFDTLVRSFKESLLPQRCQHTVKAGDPHVGSPASSIG